MIALLHNLPTSVTGLLIAGLMVAASIGGIHLVGRFEPPEKRHDYNDIVGFVIAVVGVVQAVLLAWVAVIAWETYDKADMLVETEASLIGDIARVADGLPPEVAALIRKGTEEYGRAVIDGEWPAMRAGERPHSAYPPLRTLQKTIVDFQPQTAGASNLHAHLLTKLTSLFDTRRERIFLSGDGIGGVVWSTVLLGTICLVGVSFFFGLEKQRHRIMTSMLALSTCFVLLMILSMDRPYLGSSGIEPGPIEMVMGTLGEEDMHK